MAALSSLIKITDRFAAGARGQGRKDGGGRIEQKVHRAIGEKEMRPTRMMAPEMKHVALVAIGSGFEAIRSRRAGAGRYWHDILLLDAEDHVGRAGVFLADAGIPPAVLEVGAGRALAGQKRLTGAVADVGKANAGIAIKNPVLAVDILARYPQITGKGDGKIIFFRDLRLEGAAVRRAHKRADDRGQPHVRRVLEWRRRLLVGILRYGQQVLLLDVRQELGQPAGKEHLAAF